MGKHHHNNQKRLFWVLIATAAYMLAEVVGSYLSGSLSLLADAGHMLSDVAALALSLFAIWIAQKPPRARRTFGYYRMEILAALANAVGLFWVAFWVLKEAVIRLMHPEPVMSSPMLVVAFGGLLVNVLGLWLLHDSKDDNMNLRGAWLHVWMDALGSVAVMVSAGIIYLTGFDAADPIASIVISLMVLYSAWQLLKEALSVLMESAPSHLDPDEIRDVIRAYPGVCEVHDLHVWTISSHQEAFSAHVLIDKGANAAQVLTDIRSVLQGRFHVYHITIQIETEPCCGDMGNGGL